MKRAKCFHILNHLEAAISNAEKKKMTHLELLHYIFDLENTGRDQTNIKRRLLIIYVISVYNT